MRIKLLRVFCCCLYYQPIGYLPVKGKSRLKPSRLFFAYDIELFTAFKPAIDQNYEYGAADGNQQRSQVEL